MGEVTDVSGNRDSNHLGMRIELTVVSKEPPTGTVRGMGKEVTFVGWLGLLRVLSELLEKATAVPDEWPPSPTPPEK